MPNKKGNARVVLFEDQKMVELNATVQTFIRTQPHFNSSNPRKYRCLILSIQNDCDPGVWDRLPFRNFVESSQHQSWYTLHNDRTVSVANLTPFQGNDDQRVFGEFWCSKCGRNWMSAGSWKDKFQKCQKCEKKVYPHTQSALKKKDGNEVEPGKQPHDCARCEKCMVEGTLCLPRQYYAV